MTAILGVSAYYHDSAAALVVDGEIVAAAQEERFTRRRHDRDFPRRAVDFCLREGGARTEESLDYIVYYEKPLLKFDRLLESYLAFAPRGFRSFRTALPVWLKEKLFLPQTLWREFPAAKRARLVFTEHHESHAASAFYPSPFDQAAILTLDGVGEWCTSAWGVGEGHRIRLEAEMEFPHSLGLLYSAFTHYCGFKVNSGEYKLMGLAPYGRPIYRELILERLIELKSDGSFWMDLDYFAFAAGLTMTKERFHQLFGGPPRTPEAEIEQRHMDLAASVQQVTEEVVLRMAREVHRQTGQKNLALAGGVALNCVANGRLQREGPFDKIWIQPAAGDAGGALGAALFAWHQLLERPRTVDGRDRQKGSLLGPRFANEAVERAVKDSGLPYRRCASEEELLESVAALLEVGKIVGWFHGRMEFGPRALGARSILGDARRRDLQVTMNLKIKFRESFRPFAPAVLAERAADYFDLPRETESPYMMLVVPVAESRRARLSDAERATMKSDPDLLRRAAVVRSEIPAVTHVDFSARVQTVDEPRHGRFYRLLKGFEQRTGCPVLANTSFNVRGEPIVCSPEDALSCFKATEMDVLALEDFIVTKPAHEPRAAATHRAKHLAQFPVD